MRKASAALLLAGATGVLTAGLSAPALAATEAAASVCTIEVLSLKANDLQEETNDGDEIKVKLDDTMHGPWDFVHGQTRSASLNSPDEAFVNSVTVTLYEQDTVFRSKIDSFVSSCSVGDHTAVLSDSRALYTMTYRITS